MQLCPQSTASWWCNLHHPSKASKFLSDLTAKAYGVAGQDTSAMALLQVYQAKALKQMHEVSSDPGLMQKLHTATGLALLETKVTARSLNHVMFTLVVQERHLVLNLADMREANKSKFLPGWPLLRRSREL